MNKIHVVKIINQILDMVCLLANFYPISLDFFRQLQRWTGSIDWSCWLVTCQLARNIDQWFVRSVWQLKAEAPCLFRDDFSTLSQMASRTTRSNHRSSRSIIDQYSLPMDMWPVNNSNPYYQFISAVAWRSPMRLDENLQVCKPYPVFDLWFWPDSTTGWFRIYINIWKYLWYSYLFCFVLFFLQSTFKSKFVKLHSV